VGCEMSKLKESRIIEKISYLSDGTRKSINATNNGTFKFPVVEVIEGQRRVMRRELTAKEFVHHPSIVNADPVVTLKDGTKIRVFNGGDPSYLPAMSEGILNKNDKFETLRRKFTDQKKKRREKKKDANDTDEYDSPFSGWNFDYYD